MKINVALFGLGRIGIMHAADLSNPYKEFRKSKKWSLRVLEEFWN